MVTRRHRGGPVPPQYNVPSQAPPVEVPFSNNEPSQADIVRQQRYKPGGGVTSVPGTIPINWYVVSTYDARPINSIDLIKSFDPLTDIDQGTDTAQFFYTVPQGRVAVFRHLEIHTYYDAEAAQTVIDAGGAPLVANVLQVRVNGAGQDQITDKRIDSAYTLGVEFEMYFIADEGEVVEFRILSGTVDTPFDPFTRVILYATGNLLLSTGIAGDFMPANQFPIPVAIALGG